MDELAVDELWMRMRCPEIARRVADDEELLTKQEEEESFEEWWAR